MIFPGQITYLWKVIGIYIILISISNQLLANDVKESYLNLGKDFENSGQYFLSYQNYVSAYLLEEDDEKAINIGLMALSPCLTMNRVEEGQWLVQSLSQKDKNPDFYKSILSLFYLKTHELDKALYFLENISLNSSNKVNLLYSYYYFLTDEYDKSSSSLEKIKSDYLLKNEVVDISLALKNPPKISLKSPILSAGISMILPGFGQIYSGLTFDGINAIVSNGLFGSTAAVLWMHEMDQDPSDRNLTLPIISTLVFSIFYVTNIYNAYNSANRYNNNQLNKHYNGVFEKFQLILNDNSLFLGYREVY